MCAAPLDFTAERDLIEITDDPRAVLDWVREYREHARNAVADGDVVLESQLDELIEFALDHAADLKAARLRPPPKDRAVTDGGARKQPTTNIEAEDDDTRPPPRAQRESRDQRVGSAASVEHLPRSPRPDPDEARRREADRRRAEERAKEKAAAEAAEAERLRVDDEELRQLHERIAQAQARRDAALATTARIEAEAKRAAAEADRTRREHAKQQAARDAEETERAAAEAETSASRVAAAAKSADLAPGVGSTRQIREAPAADPQASTRAPARASAAAVEELSPLAMLFRDQLGDLIGAPSPDHRAAAEKEAPLASRERANPSAPTPMAAPSPTPPPKARRANTPAVVAPTNPVAPTVAPPSSTPIDDLPALTGTDLASFRNWLGVSQRALATKLGVEQSSVSRGEGKPTTVLPASLRQALHKAMGEPRPDLAGIS